MDEPEKKPEEAIPQKEHPTKETSKKKWYQTTVTIIALLIFFFPAGLFLMWKYSKWNKVVKWVITGFFGLMVLGSMTSNSSKTSSPTNTQSNTNSQVTQQPTIPPATPTTDPNPKFTDGTHEIGKDIKPGIYRTRTGSSGCYYSRLSGFSGELSEILANENTDYPAVIDIKPTDKGFKSSRCGTWTQDISQITSSKTTFTDGIYIIGTDIEPGTYKSSGSSGCYYSRLRGFSGSIGDIISNENTDEAAIITIASTDKGFKSSRCGTWTKN